MKKYVLEFLRRGLIACGLGPIVLAILYLILHQHAVIETLSVHQVALGIFSLSALAFIAGGMNVLYQIERLPLMPAILIHGAVLYASYLCTYLINNWLEWSAAPIIVFSIIFAAGYLIIWLIIYSITKRNTRKINQMLRQKQQTPV